MEGYILSSWRCALASLMCEAGQTDYQCLLPYADGFLAQGSHFVAPRLAATGKFIETEFVFDFTLRAGKIARFRMFEDSFAVAQAVVPG